MKQVTAEEDGHKRRGIFGSPELWLKEKAEIDQRIWGNEAGHWVIDNQEYDLSGFAEHHPGGSHWITLTKGQNISEHFHVHHLDLAKARAVLEKYRVRASPRQAFRFSFEADGLYETIRLRLLARHSARELQDSSSSQRLALVMLACFLGCLTATAWLNSYVLAGVTALTMVGCMGLGHNFLHQRKNWGRFMFEMSGLGHQEWTIFHAISHHLYPNTNVDYEIATFEPLVRFLKSQPANPIYTELLLQPFYLVMIPLNILLKLLKPLRGIPFDPCCLLCLAEVPFFMAVGGLPLWPALRLFLAMQGLFGFIVTKTLFCGHRQSTLWAEGDARVQDFGEHTAIATNDNETGLNAFVSFLFFSGFNIHIAHHLFPTIDHSRLPLANAVVQEVLRERGLHYNCSTKVGCMVEYSKCVVRRVPFAKLS